MTNLTRLSDLIEDEEFSKKFIFYEVEAKSLKFIEEETGWGEIQRVRTEYNLGWNPIRIDKDRIGIISSKATTYTLGLQGENGYNNSTKLIQRFAEMYGNEKLKTEGISITQDIFENLPEHMKYGDSYYWLASPYKNKTRLRHIIYYGIKFVGFYSDHKCDLYNSENFSFRGNHSIRPVVILPQDILVDIGDSHFDGSAPDRGFKLKLNN